MAPWLQIVLTILSSVLASSGLWAFLTTRFDLHSAEKEMLIGLGHDRIMYLGMRYIERGWITQDEYENLNTYLYEPYKKLGGNGSANRVMQEVNKLPIRQLGFEGHGGTKNNGITS